MSVRGRALVVDVAIGAALAGLFVALTPGLALVAVIALAVLILVGGSLTLGFAWSRLGPGRHGGSGPRRRSPRSRVPPATRPVDRERPPSTRRPPRDR